MSEAATAGVFEERPDAGRLISYALAAAVHLLLLAVLLFGVRWQNRPPEAVVVELWREPPPPPVQVAPKPEPVPTPVVEPPKPEPVIEKPEIAIKEPPKPKPEAVKPKPVPKPIPKPEPKLKPEPPKAKPVPQAKPEAKPRPRDDEMQKRMREELAREQVALQTERERQAIKDQLTRDSAAVNNKALAAWADKVRARVRSNIPLLPQDIKGNPEAIFDVVQLPTGEVLSVKLRKSSGMRALDDVIERAILKSSPLPKLDRPELFMRAFELKYRPLD